MKLQDIKIGDKIRHYCSGEEVIGTVIKKDDRSVTTQHQPVTWAGEKYTETHISGPTPLQEAWSRGNFVVPKAHTMNGERIRM